MADNREVAYMKIMDGPCASTRDIDVLKPLVRIPEAAENYNLKAANFKPDF